LNQELNGSIFREKGIRLIIKREDLVYPEIQGNKWRKLKYNLTFAQEKGFQQILSFGGAYSVSRSEYKSYTQQGQIKELQKQYPHAYMIPEGGTNALAIKGCEEILTEEDRTNFDYFACPVGTAGTITGLISSLKGNKKVIAFSALKGSFVQNDIEILLKQNKSEYTNFELIDQYHFGGYAKHKPELLDFIYKFYEDYQIPLDPIYTGKMIYGLMDMIKKDHFAAGTSILAVHTGGLQGIAGFNERFGTKLKVK